jgi:hypothetical protein
MVGNIKCNPHSRVEKEIATSIVIIKADVNFKNRRTEMLREFLKFQT